MEIYVLDYLAYRNHCYPCELKNVDHSILRKQIEKINHSDCSLDEWQDISLFFFDKICECKTTSQAKEWILNYFS